jgi:serine protease Do
VFTEGMAPHRGILIALLAFQFGWSVLAAGPAPLVINDSARWQKFADELGALANAGKAVSPDVLREQAAKPVPAPIRLARASRTPVEADTLYQRSAGSVVGIASVYKCNHCPHWHTAGTATGWVIGSNGEIASNHHVFAETRGTNVVGVGILTLDGRTFPVLGVLAADKARDIAVVRTGATGLTPLALSAGEPVGRPISALAHPTGQLWTLTQGYVSRYALQPVGPGEPPVPWMFVTADFAVGSSGGPVFNRYGAVVGMISRTHTISADPKQAGATAQMVVKLTVPAASILEVVQGK